jgi:hypothetical protein
MKQQSGISKSSQQKLARVLEQMESWKNQKTRLILSIDSPLFYLTLRGRIVGRLERLFLFDTYGETCRIAVIPERYDRVLHKQKGPASVKFETSQSPGQLELHEDNGEAMFAEMCTDWVLSKMCTEAADSNTSDALAQCSKPLRSEPVDHRT